MLERAAAGVIELTSSTEHKSPTLSTQITH